MRPSLAALAAVAAATTIGGTPALVTHVERRSIHHKYTPCNPTPHTVEQAPMPPRGCRNAEATSRGPTWPSPSAGPSRRWQEPSTARKGAPSPNPTALHPHRAESSGAKSNYGPTTMLRSPRQPHTQIDTRRRTHSGPTTAHPAFQCPHCRPPHAPPTPTRATTPAASVCTAYHHHHHHHVAC